MLRPELSVWRDERGRRPGFRAARRPRVLAISWDVPYPPDHGGRIRSFYLLKALRDAASVSVLAFGTEADDRARGDPFRALGFSLRVVPPREVGYRWWHHLITTEPLLLQQYTGPAMREAVAAHMIGSPVDMVISDGLFAAEAVRAIRDIPVLYQAHNVESEVYRRVLGLAPLPPRRHVAARIDCRKTEWAERKTVRAFRFLTAVSERDREVLQRWNPRASIHLVPNGVDAEYFHPEPLVEPERGALVFTGTLTYPPNRDAALFFARAILPRIRAALPAVRWYVVGRAEPDLRTSLQAEPGVVCTGYVDDVRPYLWRAEVAVVPLRAGGGTRLKILEAMATARPVVSTSLGAEGLPFRDGVEICRADTAEAFAAAVVDLLRCPAAARDMAAAGRRAILGHYDWSRIAKDYRATVLDIWQTWTEQR